MTRHRPGEPVRIEGHCSSEDGEDFHGARGRVVECDNPTGRGADGQAKVLVQTERGIVAVPEKALRK